MKWHKWILGIMLITILASVSSNPIAARGPQNLIIIIWDGTQRAHLRNLLRRGRLPHLTRLINRHGLGLPVIDTDTCKPSKTDKYSYATSTGPGNSAIVTGMGFKRPRPGMRNCRNAKPRPIPDSYTLFEFLKERDYSTGLVSTKSYKFWPHIPLTNTKPGIDFWWARGGNQRQATDQALAFLRDVVDTDPEIKEPFFLWLHHQDPDRKGHRFGENSREYDRAIRVDDRHLGILLRELGELGLRQRTLVVITTDHGFVENGDHHRACTKDTKDLFLVVNKRLGILNCVATQTDIAGCLKPLF